MKHTPDSAKQRASLREEVGGVWPCIKGSLAEVRKPCGRPSCPACRSGNKHPAHILSYRQGGKVRCRYVPREWVAALRQAIANGRGLEQRMAELSGELLEQFRQQRTQTVQGHVGGKKSTQ